MSILVWSRTHRRLCALVSLALPCERKTSFIRFFGQVCFEQLGGLRLALRQEVTTTQMDSKRFICVPSIQISPSQLVRLTKLLSKSPGTDRNHHQRDRSQSEQLRIKNIDAAALKQNSARNDRKVFHRID